MVLLLDLLLSFHLWEGDEWPGVQAVSRHGVPPRSCHSQVDPQGVIPLQTGSPWLSKPPPRAQSYPGLCGAGGNRGGSLLRGAGNGAQQAVWGGNAADEHGIVACSPSQCVS